MHLILGEPDGKGGAAVRLTSTVHPTKAESRLVAYLRIVSVWMVPRVIIPLQNVDTVLRNGLFTQLAVFSRRIKGTTRSAAVPVWICTRCITLSLLSSSFLRCLVLTQIRIPRDDTGGEILSRCIDHHRNDTRRRYATDNGRRKIARNVGIKKGAY
jgi:hypothetical protein